MVTELSVEHVLLFVVAAFLLYYLMGSCGCRNGFRVGGQRIPTPHMAVTDGSCPEHCEMCNCEPPRKVTSDFMPGHLFYATGGCGGKCMIN